MTEKTKVRINRFSRFIIIITSIIGLTAIITEYGFHVSKDDAVILHYVAIAVVLIFIIYQIMQLFIAENKIEHIKSHKIEFLIILFISIETVLLVLGYSLIKKLGTALHLKDIAFLYIVFAQIYIIIGLIAGGLRYNKKILQFKIHPSRLFVLSFVFLIIIGTLLLLLPASTVNGHISFFDALFTSTSAVCVTGLITVDTATYFSRFGQIVIMLLFQIGGLGLMTFTTFFTLFLAGGLGIKERIILNDLMNEENVGAITKVLAYLTIITIIIESIGALILFQSIASNHNNLQEAIFNSIFHSISAFCNAGFSIFSLNLMDPLVKSNYLFTTTISVLIILGGIGFPTIMGILNIKSLKSIFGKFKFKVTLQIRLILYTTLILIIAGTAFTFLLEYNNSLALLNFWEKIYAAYFQSVSSRTAG
ncbi:MAG: potassium transporter TrkG, partial [Ignavibacteriaceae bacterium]